MGTQMTPEEMEAAYLDGRLTYEDMQSALVDELTAADKVLGGGIGDAMELILEAAKPSGSRLPDLVAGLDRPDLMLMTVAKVAAMFMGAGVSLPQLGLLASPLWEQTDG